MYKILVPLAVAKIPSGVTIPTHFIRETYLARLLEHGLEPVLVSPIFPKELIDEYYQNARGMLLMGGGDIDPVYYRASPHPATKIDDARRDALELDLARRAMEDRKPILAICRGVQVLAIAQGGTLHQHLPDIVPDEKHGVSEGGTYDNLLEPEHHHDVLLDAGSRIRALLGKDTVSVPSGHHQAVDAPGRDLVISGRSPRGVAEIIEHSDKNYFCFGVQSHPEIEPEGDLGAIFVAFAEAAAKYQI